MTRIGCSFIGAYSLAAIDAAPAEVAGPLIKRLAAWILRGELPPLDELPAAARPLWVVIEAESSRICDARKQQREAGRAGGQAKAARAQGARENFRIDFPADSLEWEARAREINDPVDLALAITGESDGKRRVFGSLLRDIGAETFRQVCVQFGREIRAGDKIANKGATLVAKLKRRQNEK